MLSIPLTNLIGKYQMAETILDQIEHVSQELNSELEGLNNHVSGAWRSLGRVSELLYEFVDLHKQLSQECQELKHFSGSWLSYKKYD